jgi:DNA-binding CsgD family transcriptional regulator
MLAGAQRRFASYKLLKRCTVIFVILSPITTLSDDVVESMFPNMLPVITLVYVLVITLGLLMASPYSYKYLFSAGWISDLHKADMTLLREKVEKADRFAKYGLTPRERDVATLLLAAQTRRMISGALGVSESTVKTHTSNLYNKLNINSRIELFRLFGVREADELPDND